MAAVALLRVLLLGQTALEPPVVLLDGVREVLPMAKLGGDGATAPAELRAILWCTAKMANPLAGCVARVTRKLRHAERSAASCTAEQQQQHLQQQQHHQQQQQQQQQQEPAVWNCSGCIPPPADWALRRPPAAPNRVSHFVARPHPSARWALAAPRELYDAVLADLDARAGLHAPAGIWHPLNPNFPLEPPPPAATGGVSAVTRLADVPRAEQDRLFERAYARMDLPVLLGAWSGSIGAMTDPANAARATAYGLVLPYADRVGMVPAVAKRPVPPSPEAACDAGSPAPGGGEAAAAAAAATADGALAEWCTAQHVMMSDMESVLDVNILLGHLQQTQRAPGAAAGAAATAPLRLRVLEIGAGFGRLAEALRLVLEPRATGGLLLSHLIVDAVPATLIYCYLYLQAAFSALGQQQGDGVARRVGFYFAGSDAEEYRRDPDQFAAFVMPAWAFAEELQAGRFDGRFDACVNVQSMQEMEQWHIDFYIHAFNRAARPGGVIFNSNSRLWQFRGEWRWPPRWGAPLLNASLPGRSWTRRFETLVFRQPPAFDAAAVAAAEGAPAFAAGMQLFFDGVSLAFAVPPAAHAAAAAAAVCAALGLAGQQACPTSLQGQLDTRLEDLGLATAHDLGLPLPPVLESSATGGDAAVVAAAAAGGGAAAAASAEGASADCHSGTVAGRVFFDAVRAGRFQYACLGEWRPARRTTTPVPGMGGAPICIFACTDVDEAGAGS
jgi:SAM-dependent methyltransferase